MSCKERKVHKKDNTNRRIQNNTQTSSKIKFKTKIRHRIIGNILFVIVSFLQNQCMNIISKHCLKIKLNNSVLSLHSGPFDINRISRSTIFEFVHSNRFC